MLEYVFVKVLSSGRRDWVPVKHLLEFDDLIVLGPLPEQLQASSPEEAILYILCDKEYRDKDELYAVTLVLLLKYGVQYTEYALNLIL
jgi:hypothetical protein